MARLTKQTAVFLFEKAGQTLLAVVLIISLGSLLLEKNFFPASLAVHFQLQYWIVALGCSLFLLARKKFYWATAGFIYVMVLYGIWIHDVRLTNHQPSSVDLVFLNSQYDNTEFAPIVDLLRQTDPSMIALVESNPELIREITAIKGGPVLNHRSYADSCTMFSQPPTTGQEILGEGYLPICTVHYEAFDLIVVHPHRPTSPEALQENIAYFDAVAEIIDQHEASGRHFLIVGDFNASRYSAFFRERFEKYDQRILYTWMVRTPFMLPIDHVLTDMPVRVGRSGNVGSDHAALLIEIF